MILEQWQKDPEFQVLSDDEKKLALLNYFDRELSDAEFQALSGETQQQVRDNFLADEGFESKGPGVLGYIDQLGGHLVEGVKETTRARATGLGLLMQKAGGSQLTPEMQKIASLMVPPEKQWPDQEDYKKLGEKLMKFARDPAWDPSPEYQEARSYAEDFVRTVPQIGSQMFAYILAGPLASFGLMGTEILGSTYQRLVDEGVEPERAYYAGVANAIIQGSLETIGIGKIASIWKPQKHILQRLKSMGSAAGTEWLTEFVQAYPDMMIDVLAKNPDKSRLEQWTMMVDQLWETTKQGAYEGTLTAPWAFLGIAAPSHVTTPTGETKPTEVDIDSLADQIQKDITTGEVDIATLKEARSRLEDTDAEAVAIDEVLTREAKEPEAEEKPETIAEKRQKQIEKEWKAEQERVVTEEPKITVVDELEKRKKEFREYAAKIQKETDELFEKTKKKIKEPIKVTPKEAEFAKTVPEGEKLPEKVVEKEIEEAAAEVETEPTEAQKEAGNYKKGHVKVLGFDITIENPKGSVREGVNKEGKKWRTELKSHYGYFKRTEGKDGDQIDVFIGENPASEKIFVVDQVDPDTGKFDEHKVMLGFNKRIRARKAYLENYEKGWQGFGAITEMGHDEFKQWLGKGRQKRPVSPEIEAAEGKIKPKEKPKEIKKRVSQKTGKVTHVLPEKGSISGDEATGYYIFDRRGNIISETEIAEPYKTVEAAQKALEAYKPPKPKEPRQRAVVKPEKAKRVPPMIRTMRGAIKKMGGINFLHFKGELKEMDTAVKYLSKKDGLPIDIVEKALRDDKWLYPKESLLEVLRDSKNLKRDRITADLLAKKEHELSTQERKVKKEIEREPEAPPEGEYKTMRAEDIPEGIELAIIEGKSTEGWDFYEVKQKDPFSVTLVDGQEIELKPLDMVQVLKPGKLKMKGAELPPKEKEGFKKVTKRIREEIKKPEVKPDTKAIANLRKVAKNLKEKAEEKYNQERQENTAKRAREAASAREDASRDIALADTMFKVADKLESGKPTKLAKIRNKTQVETLEQILNRAKYDRLSTQYKSYGDRQAYKDAPITAEDVKFAKYPDNYMPTEIVRGVVRDVSAIHGGKELSGKIREYSAYEDAKEVVQFLKKKGKKPPWQWEDSLTDIDRLKKIGIKNEADLKAALTELVELRAEKKVEDSIKKLERELVGQKIQGFIQTPKVLADRMVEEAQISKGMDILEPSAGSGRIADSIKESGVKPDVIEIVPTLRKLLEAKDYDVVSSDFLEYTGKKYDRIIMNPPFEKGQDITHVKHAYGLLKPEGRIVSIMSEGPFFRSDKQSKAFNEWFEGVEGYSEKLDPGSFKGAQQQRQTGVSGRLVIIDKADAAAEVAAPPRGIAITPTDPKEISAFLDPVIRSWANAPKVRVVKNTKQLPEGFQKFIDPKAIVRAVYHRGTVYLVADRLSSPIEAAKSLMHETFGHYGLKGMLGDEISPVMKRIYKVKRSEIQPLAKLYDFDLTTQRGRDRATEEWLAREVVVRPESTWVQKIISAIKEFFRKIGLDAHYTDAEITNLLSRSRKFVQEGVSVVPEGILEPAFEKEDKASEYLKRLRTDPDFTKYKKKLKAQDDFRKEGRDLFSYAKQRFGKGYVDRDMKWYNAAFETPYALGKKFASMKSAVGTEINAAEKRNAELFNDYEGKLGDVQRAMDKPTQRDLQNLIWKWDGIRFPESEVPTDWHKPLVKGEDIEINPEHYEEAGALLKNQGVTDSVIDAFLTIRKKLDEKFVDIDKTMRVEKLDPTDIEEFRGEINKIHNYFPHRRTGNTQVTITKKETGEVVYREHYNGFKDRMLPVEQKAPARAQAWLESKGDISNYEIHSPAPVKQLPDEVFFQIPVEAMQQILKTAGTKLEQSRVEYEAERLFTKHKVKTHAEAIELARKRLTADLERALSKAVADTLKVRGWARHAVGRKNIPGHETEDVFGILFDYLSGYAGFKTKITRAREHSKTLNDINAKKNPDEYRYVSNYVKDMLANQDKVDRAVDTLRGLFFVKYLGFVVKSGAINLTQNVVLAAPVLSVYTSGAHLKIAKAMKDTRRALTSKNAWTLSGEVKYPGLKKDEQKALHELIESGASQDLFVRELKGNMPKVGWGKHFRKLVDYSGIFMQIAEKFNRASTGLAAYRIGIKKYGMDHDKAVIFAKQIIYDSHFLYGGPNLPSLFRGGPVRKIMRSGYTFRSFTHNYLNIIAHMLKNQGWSGRIAAARSLRNVFIMGGLTSIPFFKAFSEALMWVIGDEDEDALTKVRSGLPNTWLKDIVTYGLPGAAGIDMSGSLSIEVPREWRDIIGVPYAAIEDTVNTYKSWKSGQKFRALSETPFTPIVLRNAARGLTLYTYGQVTRSGRAITGHPAKFEAQKLTRAEMVKKALLGFQATKLSKGYAAYEAVQKTEDIVSAKQKEFADRYVNAFRRGDSEGQREVILEIRQWNERAEKEGKLHLMIDIRKMIESRIRPAWETIRKVQRPNYLRIVEEWQ